MEREIPEDVLARRYRERLVRRLINTTGSSSKALTASSFNNEIDDDDSEGTYSNFVRHLSRLPGEVRLQALRSIPMIAVDPVIPLTIRDNLEDHRSNRPSLPLDYVLKEPKKTSSRRTLSHCAKKVIDWSIALLAGMAGFLAGMILGSQIAPELLGARDAIGIVAGIASIVLAIFIVDPITRWIFRLPPNRVEKAFRHLGLPICDASFHEIDEAFLHQALLRHPKEWEGLINAVKIIKTFRRTL